MRITKEVMKMSKLFEVIVALLVVVLAFVWVYSAKKGSVTYSSENTPYSVLLSSNTSFAEAQAAANTGDYQTAKSKYEQALGTAQDSIQKGQIDFKLALLEDSLGNNIKAIQLYKAIIANPDYDNFKLIKAYSAQSMAELYYRTNDPAITAEIFKDAPYSDMVDKDHIGLTYRHLDEYAIGFYPLALAELRIANWYSGYFGAKSTPDGSDSNNYPEIVKVALQLANADIERTKNDPNASRLIPQTLVRKETLYINMYRNKLATADETEQVCKEALKSYEESGLAYQDGFARYYYAVFLATQGTSRTADMKSVLAPVYTDSGYKKSFVWQYFADEKQNLHGKKKQIANLARKIPKFKTFLVSLGWREADF